MIARNKLYMMSVHTNFGLPLRLIITLLHCGRECILLSKNHFHIEIKRLRKVLTFLYGFYLISTWENKKVSLYSLNFWQLAQVQLRLIGDKH